MKTDFTIREAQQTDTIALKELFQNTVLAVNSKDYSQAEVEDWASCGDDLSNIEEMITARPFFEKKGYIVKEEQKRKANQLSLTNFWMAREMAKIKPYNGRIPACGVFCGGCPIYTREKRACRGAELNHSRCEKCKTFHLCCFGKKITHCFQCSNFPCTRFKGFAKRWQKHGQDFIENQKLLSEIGEVAFLEYYNKKVTD